MKHRAVTPEQKEFCKDVRYALGNIQDRINRLGTIFNEPNQNNMTPIKNPRRIEIQHTKSVIKSERDSSSTLTFSNRRMQSGLQQECSRVSQENDDIMKQIAMLDTAIKQQQQRTYRLIEDQHYYGIGENSRVI